MNIWRGMLFTQPSVSARRGIWQVIIYATQNNLNVVYLENRFHGPNKVGKPEWYGLHEAKDISAVPIVTAIHNATARVDSCLGP